MTRDYKSEIEQRKIIIAETRSTRKLAFGLLLSTVILGLMAGLISLRIDIDRSTRENAYWALVLGIIVILILILSVRKTIYYSPRFVPTEGTLEEILRAWRRIDRTLLLVAGLIPVLGVLITWLGMPFERTWFIFLVSAILLVILMPVGIKVRSKLGILGRYRGDI